MADEKSAQLAPGQRVVLFSTTDDSYPLKGSGQTVAAIECSLNYLWRFILMKLTNWSPILNILSVK